MQQLLQNIRDGKLSLAQVPDPLAQPGELLIANCASVISAGTEKMVMDLAKKSLLGKARERPDHVRRVLEKVRNEGLLTTIRQVREKLDSPMSMGYSSAGVVLACGAGVQGYKPGDRVSSNGPHAEIVSAPRNLCARVPDSVPFDHAAFAVLGAIAMQGVRLAQTGLGETVFVIGLGLIGQLAVSILNAAGCRVIGTDPDAAKCELALRMGAELARPNLSAQHVADVTRGLGADAVVITASTQSNGPIELAAGAVRQKGRVVLVGVVGLELDRRAFYFKEAEFVVSCSYGPGRYDVEYEERGHDYPAAYVRWTEQRNIQSVLDLMGRGRLDVSPLISHRFAIDRATDAYAMIEQGSEPYLGIVLEYPPVEARVSQKTIRLRGEGDGKLQIANCKLQIDGDRKKTAVGVLGAGNFARMVLLPALAATGKLQLATLCTSGGVSAATVGPKLGFAQATTDEDSLFTNPDLDAIVSITRHDQHARHVLKAIQSGKHVFVEKPLCLTVDELEQIESALAAAGDAAPVVMVGFNRRFSPAARQLQQFFADVAAPLTISVRFNAGQIPPEHWTQDDTEGGGRIIGEACHGIDLATYLAGSPPVRVYAESVGVGTGGASGTHEISDDQCFITLRHANGSVSSIAYLAGGDKAFPKERVEVFGGGRVAVIDDFRSITTCAKGRTKRHKLGSQDKGHLAEIDAFATCVAAGGPAPIPWSDLRGVSLASILAVRSLREGVPFELA